MTPRERVYAALDYKTPDMVPLECHSSPAGLYEHGTRLNALWSRFPQDFGDLSNLPLPNAEDGHFDPDGSGKRMRRDEWGVIWEEPVVGIMGHPVIRPLDDLANLDSFRIPEPPALHGPDFEAQRDIHKRHRESYFLKSGWINVFEVMRAVRKFEDVLMDLALDTKEINQIADIACDYQEGVIRYLLACGVDGIQFGDDLGTQSGLLMSPDRWREFFKHRYKRLIAPIKQAGVKVFFHTCGMVWPLLEDLRDMGVDAIWPQLNVYNMAELAGRCRELGFAVTLRPEHSHLMTTGMPDQVRSAVHSIAETFRPQDGGSWFYIEVDNGFPYANVEALFETIGEYRVGAR